MSGEVAALLAAFDQEFEKAIGSLPSISDVSNHDAFLNHSRGAVRVSELIAYYSGKLPPSASVQRILGCADRLIQRGEHAIAMDSCYQYIFSLDLPNRDIQRMDAHQRLSYHASAGMGLEVCKSAIELQADPQLKHPRTLAALVSCLVRLQEVVSMSLPVENLYWLTLNGTVRMYTLAKQLVTAGFASQALPSLIFCLKATEAHVVYSSPKYLPWRTQLSIALCNAYLEIKDGGAAAALAKKVAIEGIAKIESLIKLQKLDPVPPPPEAQAAYQTAKAALSALQLKTELSLVASSSSGTVVSEGAPGGKGAAAAAAPPPPKAPGKGAAPPPPPSGPDAPLPSSLEPLASLIQETSLTPLNRLTALMEALHVPGGRTLKHQPPPSVMHKDLFEVVSRECKPRLVALNEGFSKAQGL